MSTSIARARFTSLCLLLMACNTRDEADTDTGTPAQLGRGPDWIGPPGVLFGSTLEFGASAYLVVGSKGRECGDTGGVCSPPPTSTWLLDPGQAPGDGAALAAAELEGSTPRMVADADEDGLDDVLIGGDYQPTAQLYSSGDFSLLARYQAEYAYAFVYAVGVARTTGDGRQVALLGEWNAAPDKGIDTTLSLFNSTQRGDLQLADADATIDFGETFSQGAAIGDLDADGIDDLAANSHYDTPCEGVALLLGPFEGVQGLADAANCIAGTAGDASGRLPLGDLDDDGHVDMLAWDYPAGNFPAFFFRGPLLQHAGKDDATLTIRGESGTNLYPQVVDFIGDFDGDGTQDLGVGASLTTVDGADSVGAAFVLLAPEGTINLEDVTLRFNGDPAGYEFGMDLTGVGDIDDDGRADIAVSAPGTPGSEDRGVVSILLGR